MNANRGKLFEETLKKQARQQHWEVIQITTGARWVSKFKVIPVATPFDFVLVYDWPDVIYCDAKQTENKTFPRDKIKEGQMNHLYTLHTRKFKSGYIVNFSTLDITVFFPANILKDCFNRIHKSLKPDQGILIGTNSQISLNILRHSAPNG